MKKIENKYELLARKLSGEDNLSSPSDWQDALEQNQGLDQQYEVLSTFWEKHAPVVGSDTKQRITGKAMIQALGQKAGKVHSMRLWYGAVAMLVVSLGLSILWNVMQRNENRMIQYVTNAGEVKDFVLPDGTEVNLNSSSTLIIQEGFTTNKRQVVLVGEGYFDVAKNDRKPFEIATSHLNIRVTGTHFNLKAYPDDKHIKASLDEGEIQLDTNGQLDPVILAPGQEAILNKENGELKVRKSAQDFSGQWTNGKIVLYNNTLEEIATMLERKFNVEIVILDDTVRNYKFSGDFSNAKLFELLGYLSAARKFNFNVKGDYIIITK